MPESPLQHNSTTPRHHSSDMSPNTQLEQEKRVRREIANCNERRRMQSINTGFQSLKILIPHSCGEKLSKACILQRAADHIKTLENEKLKLQSQNEQFRILIKSFQIDSTSILQGKRRLSTNDTDDLQDTNVFDDVKNHQTYWHAQYIPTTDNDNHEKFYRTPTTVDNNNTTYMIVKQNQPSQRCYKTNSLDQNQDKTNNNIVIVERCQVRAQSVDTNTATTVSRRNLQTIVEAIRHLEGEDALANINTNIQQTNSPSQQQQQQQQEELPAQIKAMINEKFQQTNIKNASSTNTIYQQTINIYEPQQTTTTTATTTTYDIDLHQKPPKKRKITFNETIDLPPISSPEVHHHEQISSDSSPQPPIARLIQEHSSHRPSN